MGSLAEFPVCRGVVWAECPVGEWAECPVVECQVVECRVAEVVAGLSFARRLPRWDLLQEHPGSRVAESLVAVCRVVGFLAVGFRVVEFPVVEFPVAGSLVVGSLAARDFPAALPVSRSTSMSRLMLKTPGLGCQFRGFSLKACHPTLRIRSRGVFV